MKTQYNKCVCGKGILDGNTRLDLNFMSINIRSPLATSPDNIMDVHNCLNI